jgi:hypothetical protein
MKRSQILKRQNAPYEWKKPALYQQRNTYHPWLRKKIAQSLDWHLVKDIRRGRFSYIVMSDEWIFMLEHTPNHRGHYQELMRVEVNEAAVGKTLWCRGAKRKLQEIFGEEL